ncbi:hypothetical protein [Cryptosporangium arvum]|uniref:DUF5129 domain-containing protein n=1 Tax=Cryptosporangium arvum DSM 44712 TaxID=927661 RepID=A0A010ZTK3_9ACTN|nr:hypothetical protein [Cryptosporangium arvum]EXG80552.1 hypothetical protein CryarDRAFT_1632 [Cryptosporangium arvum DSM 44712]
MRTPYRWLGGLRGIAQLAGLVVAAALAGQATVTYSAANDGWQGSVRQEVARSSAIQEQVRAVYGDEAPKALRIVVDERLATELDRLSADNPLAATQRDTARATADSLRAANRKYFPATLPADRQYTTDDGGADVVARLRVLRRSELDEQRAAGEPIPDPASALRDGDAAGADGLRYALGAVGASLLAALLAAVHYRARHRRRQQEVAELVEQPRQSAAGRHRQVTVVILTLWAVGAVLPLAQLVFGAEEQRSQATAARLAAVLTTDIAASTARTEFLTQGRQVAQEVGVRARARELSAESATPSEAADRRAVAAAEERASAALDRIAASMARTPRADDQLDQRMATALTSDEADWTTLIDAQNDQADRAGDWGDRSNRMVWGIVLITGFATLFGVAEWRYENVTRASTGR